MLRGGANFLEGGGKVGGCNFFNKLLGGALKGGGTYGSVATRLVRTQLLSNLRFRAMGWWVGFGSVGPKETGLVQAGSLLKFPLAGSLLAG